MKHNETYFEQVPTAVVEKMLAQQDPPPAIEPNNAEAVNERPAIPNGERPQQ